MAEVKHGDLRPGVASGNHVIHDWEVADAAARLALVVTELKVGKVCRQLSDNSWWILKRFTGGALWERLDNEASGPALSNATPAPLGTAAPGTDNAASRGDHAHAHGDQAGGSLHSAATGAAAGFMSSSDKTKLDGIAAGATVAPSAPGAAPPDVAAASSTGAAGTYATATHTHGHGAQPLGTGNGHAVATGAVAGFMSATDKSKLDGIAPGGGGPAAPASPPPDIAAAGATGATGTYATATHTHGHGTQAGGSTHAVATTGAAGFLSASDKTKLDGIATGATVAPSTPGAAPPDVGAVGAIGNPASYATGTHTHGHGSQAGGTLHALAGAAPGFMSAADKTKLDGLPSSVTAPPAAPGAAPPDIAAAGATGTAGTYATATHTHGHGAQAGGTTHAVATTSVAGFLSAADKTKLDGLAPVDISGKADKNFSVVTFTEFSLTVTAAHNGALLIGNMASGSAEQYAFIDLDENENLPVGFTVTLVRGADNNYICGFDWVHTEGPSVNVLINDDRVAGCRDIGSAITAVKIGPDYWWLYGDMHSAWPDVP